MVSISVAKLFRISKASEGLPRDQDIIFIMIYYNSWLWLWFWLFCRQRNSGFVKFIYQYCSEFKIQLTTPVSREIFPLFIKATKKKMITTSSWNWIPSYLLLSYSWRCHAGWIFEAWSNKEFIQQVCSFYWNRHKFEVQTFAIKLGNIGCQDEVNKWKLWIKKNCPQSFAIIGDAKKIRSVKGIFFKGWLKSSNYMMAKFLQITDTKRFYMNIVISKFWAAARVWTKMKQFRNCPWYFTDFDIYFLLIKFQRWQCKYI